MRRRACSWATVSFGTLVPRSESALPVPVCKCSSWISDGEVHQSRSSGEKKTGSLHREEEGARY